MLSVTSVRHPQQRLLYAPRASSGYLLRMHRGSMLYPLRAEDRSRIPILEEVASMPTVSSPRSGRVKTDKNNLPVLTGMSAWTDIYAMCGATVCCRARANALAKHIVESRTQWQKQPNTSAYSPVVGLEVPYMSGISASTSLCRQGANPLLLSSRPRCSVYALCVTRCVKWSKAGPATGSCRRTVAVLPCGSCSRVWIGIRSFCIRPGISFTPL